MQINQQDFFREVTLRICSSLEIEKALWQALRFVCQVIPADGMTLSTYQLDRRNSKLIAVATKEGGRIAGLEARQGAKAHALIEKWYKKPGEGHHVRIIDSVKKDPLLGPVVKALGVPDVPALQMRLNLDRRMLGTLVVTNTQDRKYTEKHAGLLMSVNEPFALALSNSLRHREVLRLKELLSDDNRFLQEELQRVGGKEIEIIGSDKGLKEVMELVHQVGPLDSPVLLLGETGTGKELIAHAIHKASGRRDGPFVAVNCGTISSPLMDSELFGHEKGAFTGADAQKRGRFERAHGGTIFLDEIGELPLDAQVRLLRVLQEKQIERVGGGRPIQVDIRIIAATHRDLEKMLEQGRFREDLFFRLRVFPIVIPPLRARSMDIPDLIRHFIRKKAKEMKQARIPRITQKEIDNLCTYDWPGNVRELENAIERALILSNGDELIFRESHTAPLSWGREKGVDNTEERLSLDHVMSNHIIKVLDMTDGRIHGPSGAASVLEVNPSTLRKRMKKLGIAFGRQWRRSV